MENPPGDSTDHEPACARVAAQFRQRWLRSYVSGKLRHDQVYPTAYELFRGSPEPILDVGCGVGLLAFYLRERGWSQPVIGLDVDTRKIRQGKMIVESRYRNIDLRVHDVLGPLPDFSGNVALFDVLHYLPLAQQSTLLTHLAKCVAPGGLLVIRDCPRDPGPRFWMTLLAEKFAQTISWNLDTPLHFPPRALIHEAFSEEEFERESRPLWGMSPFNNHIFIFRRRVSGAAPTLG